MPYGVPEKKWKQLTTKEKAKKWLDSPFEMGIIPRMIKKKPKGWKSESARHALARKGIKTSRKKDLTKGKWRKEFGYSQEPAGKPFKVGNTITLAKADFGFPKGAKAKVIGTTVSGDFAIIELPNGMKAMATRGWHT